MPSAALRPLARPKPSVLYSVSPAPYLAVVFKSQRFSSAYSVADKSLRRLRSGMPPTTTFSLSADDDARAKRELPRREKEDEDEDEDDVVAA